jgi:ferredoxin
MNVSIVVCVSRNARLKAILPDSEPAAEAWLKLNARLSEVWPNITQRRDPLADADAMQDKKDKFETFFTEAPGEGN